MDLNSLQDTFVGFYNHWQRVAYVIIILLVALAFTLVIHLLLRKRYKREAAIEHPYRDAMLGALNAPVQCLAWVIALSIGTNTLTADGKLPLLAQTFPPARDVVAIAIAAWFLIRLTRRGTNNLQARAMARGREFDETAADAIWKLVTALIIIVAALVMVQSLGFSVTSLLTFGGVAGIAFGFAAQSLVANLLGGVTIYTSRPFKVGDHVIFPNSSLAGEAQYIGWQAGEVQHIGWRATRIQDWNGKPFYVPNSKFNTQTIINHSRMAYRQFSEYVYLRLEDINKVADIVAEANRMLEEHPDMGDYIVFKFDGYGDYALKLYLYAYTNGSITSYTEFMRVKQDLLLKIAAIVDEHGAKLALPLSTVYMPKGLAVHGSDASLPDSE